MMGFLSNRYGFKNECPASIILAQQSKLFFQRLKLSADVTKWKQDHGVCKYRYKPLVWKHTCQPQQLRQLIFSGIQI